MDNVITTLRQFGWCWCWSARKTEDHFDLKQFIVEKPKVFWIMGPPKTGKTTLANLLIRETNYELIRPSKLIKEEAEKAGYMSETLKELIKGNKPVFDETVINAIKGVMHKTESTAKGYIIDGFPIDIKQGKLFEFEIYRPSIVIYTRLPEDRAKASNNDPDYLTSLGMYHRLHHLYEMKTLKVEMNEKPEILCQKLLKDLTEYWGYTFDKVSKGNYVLEDNASTTFSIPLAWG